MTLENSSYDNFYLHPCYLYPLEFNGKDYDTAADAIYDLIEDRLPSVNVSDTWDKWRLIEDAGLDILADSSLSEQLAEIHRAKFITNEDDYLLHKLRWFKNPIEGVDDLPKGISSAIYRVHCEILNITPVEV